MSEAFEGPYGVGVADGPAFDGVLHAVFANLDTRWVGKVLEFPEIEINDLTLERCRALLLDAVGGAVVANLSVDPTGVDFSELEPVNVHGETLRLSVDYA